MHEVIDELRIKAEEENLRLKKENFLLRKRVGELVDEIDRLSEKLYPQCSICRRWHVSDDRHVCE